MNHLFISYRHESEEHARSVNRLGELLRQAGLLVELDQFYLKENPGGPDDGWPKWCEDRANQSACVLIIASPGWFAAYDKTAPAGTGLGAASEADLFRQSLHDAQGHNTRIRLVFLSDTGAGLVPERWRAWHQFQPLNNNHDLDQLKAWAEQRLGMSKTQSTPVQPQAVQWPAVQHDFHPDIANRKAKEWPAIREMLAGRSRQRILLIEANSGYGKSELLHQLIAYAGILDIPVCKLDFRAGYDNVPAILSRLALDLGDHLPNFARDGDKTHLLIKDLRALRRPVLLVLDTFEKAAGVFHDWVCQSLLAEVERALAVTVVIAGQPALPDAEDVRWRNVCRNLPLTAIQDIADWKPWIDKRFPGFDKRNVDLPTLILASAGVPKIFSDLCRTIAGQAVQPTT